MCSKKTIRTLYELIEEELYKEIYNSSKYKEISNRYNIQEELLKNCTREDEFEIYEQCVECNNELNWLYTEEAFLKGFSMAIQLFMDSLKK